MVRSLAAASPYHDKQEAAWLKERENAAFEELGRGTSARLQPLDAQFAAALIKTLPEQLHIRAQAKEMEAYKNDTAITGRQAVRVIYDWLLTDAHVSTFFSFHDLSQLTWLGANQRASKIPAGLGSRSRPHAIHNASRLLERCALPAG